jgi:hypothetical protein
VLDAEALLLVDDQQAQVLEADVAGEQAVGADDDVDAPLTQPLDRRLGVRRGLEAAEPLHRDGEAGVPLGEGVQVLLGEQRGGGEHGDLLAVLHRLEGGADRDLRLAVADVAEDEPVHGDRLLHVLLDVLDGGELVGGLDELEGILELALPGGVGAEGVSGRGLPRGVQAHQLVGDLADRLAGLGLGLRPVGAAHAVDAGLLAADVLRDLVELVGGDVEPVPGLALLRGRVLDDEVLAGGALRAGADGAAGHLHEAADAVVGVDDVVAGAQLQRVDDVAAPRGHLPLLAASRPGLPGQVALGGEDQLQVLGHEPLGEGADGDHGLSRGDGLLEPLGEDGGHPLGAEVLGGMAGAARSSHGGQHGPALGAASLEVLRGVGGLPGVAGMGGGAGGGEVEVGVEPEGGEGEPGTAALAGVALRLGQRHEARRAHVDREPAAGGGAGPGRGEELVGRGDELLGAGAGLLGVDHEEAGPGGEHVGDLLHAVDEDGAEGFHPVGRDPVGDAQQQVSHAGQLLGAGAGALAHGGGQEDLAAGRGVEPVRHRLEGALVGDGEPAHVVDLVAEEVDAHGVRLGGREDVEDPAAHRELAALLDHVHAHVGGVDELALEVLEGVLLPHPGADRAQISQSRGDGLQEGAHGHEQHVHRVLRLRMGDAAQGLQALRDGVGARGEPLMGQGLPGGQLGEVRRADEGRERRAQVLGGAGGRGDHHQRLLGARATGEVRDGEGEQRGGRDDVAALPALAALADELADRGEVGAGGELLEQRRQRRGGPGSVSGVCGGGGVGGSARLRGVGRRVRSSALPGVEALLGGGEPLEDERLDGVGRVRDQQLERAALGGGEGGEDVVGGVPAARRAAHAHPDSQVVLGAERLGDVAQAVVPALAAAALQAHRVEGDVDLVVHDDDLLGGDAVVGGPAP